MNTTFPLAIILSLVVLGGACHTSPAVAADGASTTNSLVGPYICDEVNIHLVIKPDGTYEASLEQTLVSRHESGVWEAKGEDIILRRRSGGIGFSIQRLRLDREVPVRLLWISPASSRGGAITYPIFHREI
jgi:hypothetical protein